VKAKRGIVVAALVLCVMSACDLGLGDDEIPFRDEGSTGEDVATADESPGASPTASPSASLTPTPSPTPTGVETVAPVASPSPDDRDGDPGDGKAKEPKPRFAFPRAGSYLYSQQGYEEFCTSTCASDPLPRSRAVNVSHGHSSRDVIIVVEGARVSSHRTVRTVTRHRRSTARMAHVVDTFTSDGSRYPIRYRPGPAIEMLELPLRAGNAWAGRWRAATSGSYRMSVGGFDQIQTAGRSIRAARIVVRMEFRGRYEGYAVVTLWVDPSSRVTVASVGSMEVSSEFGRYTSDFDTRLRRGPGY
jgi:hypothetical protein